MTTTAAWLLNPGQTRQMTRQAPVTPMTPIDAMTSRSGVIPGGTPFALTGSGMTGSVAVGRAYVQGSTAQGAYPVAITAAEPITVANGHATLPRIDSLFLVVYDQLFDTSGQTLAAVVYVQGTAASTPAAPPAPTTTNAALRLWDIAVAAGASAGSPIDWNTALTDRRLYTVAAGGIAPAAAAGAYSGQYRDSGTGTGLERYNGSAWEQRLYLGTSGRLVIGNDASLYRDSANTLRTPGNLVVDGIGGRQFARVAADQSVTNSTTLVDATGMSFSVVSGGVYVVRGLLGGTGSTTGDVKIGFAAPAGSTLSWTPNMQPAAATATVGSVITDRSTLAQTQTLGTIGAAAIMTARIDGLLVAGATGTFKLQFAQGAADAGTASILKADSYLLVERVA